MMNSNAFREKLVKIMPGYSWTIHKPSKGATKLVATGVQSSGFNRISTLQVTHSATSKGEWYEAQSAGYGRRSPWLHKNGDLTLARALRGLQDHYQQMAAVYDGHANALKNARVGQSDTEASA